MPHSVEGFANIKINHSNFFAAFESIVDLAYYFCFFCGAHLSRDTVIYGDGNGGYS